MSFALLRALGVAVAVAASPLAGATITFAQTLAVTMETDGNGLGYGGDHYQNFSAELDARFTEVVIIPDLSDLDLMLEHDALMIQLRSPGSTLSETEQANLAAYIDTGRRALFIGERSQWISWDESFLLVAGGDWLYQTDISCRVANSYTPLTDGVREIRPQVAGAATGGLNIFHVNFVTIWPGNGTENLLSVLDADLISDEQWGTYDNGRFGSNVAQWLLAGGSSNGPEFRLAVEGDCPDGMQLTASGAEPGGYVGVAYSFDVGDYTLLEPCWQVQFSLYPPRRFFLLRADETGTVTVTGRIPRALCGRAYIQAIDSQCRPSTVIRL